MEKANDSLTPSGPAPLLDTTAVAKILGVKNHRSLEQWRFRGKGDKNGGVDCHGLRWIRVGSLVRYRAEDVERFIAGDRPARKKRR